MWREVRTTLPLAPPLLRGPCVRRCASVPGPPACFLRCVTLKMPAPIASAPDAPVPVAKVDADAVSIASAGGEAGDMYYTNEHGYPVTSNGVLLLHNILLSARLNRIFGVEGGKDLFVIAVNTLAHLYNKGVKTADGVRPLDDVLCNLLPDDARSVLNAIDCWINRFHDRVLWGDEAARIISACDRVSAASAPKDGAGDSSAAAAATAAAIAADGGDAAPAVNTAPDTGGATNATLPAAPIDAAHTGSASIAAVGANSSGSFVKNTNNNKYRRAMPMLQALDPSKYVCCSYMPAKGRDGTAPTPRVAVISRNGRTDAEIEALSNEDIIAEENARPQIVLPPLEAKHAKLEGGYDPVHTPVLTDYKKIKSRVQLACGPNYNPDLVEAAKTDVFAADALWMRGAVAIHMFLLASNMWAAHPNTAVYDAFKDFSRCNMRIGPDDPGRAVFTARTFNESSIFWPSTNAPAPTIPNVRHRTPFDVIKYLRRDLAAWLEKNPGDTDANDLFEEIRSDGSKLVTYTATDAKKFEESLKTITTSADTHAAKMTKLQDAWKKRFFRSKEIFNTLKGMYGPVLARIQPPGVDFLRAFEEESTAAVLARNPYMQGKMATVELFERNLIPIKVVPLEATAVTPLTDEIYGSDDCAAQAAKRAMETALMQIEPKQLANLPMDHTVTASQVTRSKGAVVAGDLVSIPFTPAMYDGGGVPVRIAYIGNGGLVVSRRGDRSNLSSGGDKDKEPDDVSKEPAKVGASESGALSVLLDKTAAAPATAGAGDDVFGDLSDIPDDEELMRKALEDAEKKAQRVTLTSSSDEPKDLLRYVNCSSAGLFPASVIKQKVGDLLKNHASMAKVYLCEDDEDEEKEEKGTKEEKEEKDTKEEKKEKDTKEEKEEKDTKEVSEEGAAVGEKRPRDTADGTALLDADSQPSAHKQQKRGDEQEDQEQGPSQEKEEEDTEMEEEEQEMGTP